MADQFTNDYLQRRARLIAYYLPQFHPIPENDLWLGRGFSEWTNVARARSMFQGHVQPRLPSDLGFYDLRLPETRTEQAELAAAYGIEGFCYWHYWFAGKQLLERPFNEVLSTGEPRLPFCLGWANVSWSRAWIGRPEDVIIHQTYPGVNDHTDHFYYLLKAFADDRYIRIEGKPLFFIYQPYQIPEIERMLDLWRELALQAGLKGLYLVGSGNQPEIVSKLGFDAFSDHFPKWRTLSGVMKRSRKTLEAWINSIRKLVHWTAQKPTILDYSEALMRCTSTYNSADNYFPSIVTNWDNTPRMGYRGVVFHNQNAEGFRAHVRQILDSVAKKPAEKRVVFVKSWNEWAEGNYLEPDCKFGKTLLEVLGNEIQNSR